MTDDELREALRQMEERYGVREDLLVVRADPVTDEWQDPDGEPVAREDVDPETQVIVIRDQLVMPREQAEREGRDILGPADTPNDQDIARVDPDSGEPDPDWRVR